MSKLCCWKELNNLQTPLRQISILQRAYWFLISSRNMGLHLFSTFALQQKAFQGSPKNLLLNFPFPSPTTAMAKIRTIKSSSSFRWVGCQLDLGDSSSKENQQKMVYSNNSNGIYSNRKFTSVNSPLYEYILSNIREPEILQQLREETSSMHGSQMQVSPDQAQLLALLVQILGAKRCIEVGVYTPLIGYSRSEESEACTFTWNTLEGYSSLAVALVLPESGRLVACERDAKSLEVAKRFYERAGVSHKVDVRHGLAADTLKSLITNGEACSYDFAFIDAEKRMYEEYFELLLQLVRVGGVIVIDNVLWYGKVADPTVNDEKTTSIRRLNKRIIEDDRVSISMVPIGDGMTICQKR